jgi:hypothetical protein
VIDCDPPRAGGRWAIENNALEEVIRITTIRIIRIIIIVIVSADETKLTRVRHPRTVVSPRASAIGRAGEEKEPIDIG